MLSCSLEGKNMKCEFILLITNLYEEINCASLVQRIGKVE